MGRIRTTRAATDERTASAPALRTDQRLIAAAAALLDAAGGRAVTIRAVAQAVGVSHNAPYKHFADRSALLGAVAMQDFTLLTDALAAVHRRHAEPLAQLEQALTLFVSYSQDHPARYRLLFSEPEIAAQGGGLEAAAMRCFDAFAVIVRGCQEANALPDVPNAELTGLIYASVHGLIDLQASGRLRKEKGAAHVHEGVALLLRLLSRG